MASITLKNIIKRYGTGKTANQVIHGVNADILDGEFVVMPSIIWASFNASSSMA